MKYVALLRGINVGGHHKVKMSDLADTFSDIGCQNVKTLLASGNVIFDHEEKNVDALIKKIEDALEKRFDFRVPVIMRTGPEIQSLIKSDPFKDIPVTPFTRLYLTFFAGKSKSTLKIPYESPGKDYTIISITDREVCTVLTLSPNRGTTDAMDVLGKEFGRAITTRNWNTVRKIASFV